MACTPSRHSLLAFGAALFLAAPAYAGPRPKPDPEFAASYATLPASLPANGGIFQASQGYAPLTSGARAAQVGDVLTIQLVERTQAVKSNSANTDRNGNIGLTPPSIGPFSLFQPAEAAFSGAGAFKGAGAAQQSNALTGEITVTIAEVLPNGSFRVRGEKLLTLNRGDEHVRIAGIVRPADITPDNRVLSTRVADARITYSGTGEIARASRQGWLNRFFSMLSPF